MVITKIVALVIMMIGAASLLMSSSTAARLTMSMIQEKNFPAADMQKTFFPPFFSAPGFRHGINFGGGKVPGFGGSGPAGSSFQTATGVVGAGFSAGVGITSSNGEAVDDDSGLLGQAP